MTRLQAKLLRGSFKSTF